MASEKRRPALVTFAAVIMIVVGMFSLVSAIAGFTNASWLKQFNDDIGGNLGWSAVVDLLLAAGYFYAAYSLFRGSLFGYYWALIFAVLNATRWFFAIFWFPVASIAVMAIDVLIIYALVSSPEWFGFSYLGSSR